MSGVRRPPLNHTRLKRTFRAQHLTQTPPTLHLPPFCRYVVLAPTDSDQVTLLKLTEADRKLEDLPAYEALLKKFSQKEVSSRVAAGRKLGQAGGDPQRRFIGWQKKGGLLWAPGGWAGKACCGAAAAAWGSMGPKSPRAAQLSVCTTTAACIGSRQVLPPCSGPLMSVQRLTPGCRAAS